MFVYFGTAQERSQCQCSRLSLTVSNYETACDILQKRFGLKISVWHQPKLAVLWKMYDDSQAHTIKLCVAWMLRTLHILCEQETKGAVTTNAITNIECFNRWQQPTVLSLMTHNNTLEHYPHLGVYTPHNSPSY